MFGLGEDKEYVEQENLKEKQFNLHEDGEEESKIRMKDGSEIFIENDQNNQSKSEQG